MPSPYNLDIHNNCSECAVRAERNFCNMSQSTVAALELIKFTGIYPKGSLLFVEGEQPRAVHEDRPVLENEPARNVVDEGRPRQPGPVRSVAPPDLGAAHGEERRVPGEKGVHRLRRSLDSRRRAPARSVVEMDVRARTRGEEAAPRDGVESPEEGCRDGFKSASMETVQQVVAEPRGVQDFAVPLRELPIVEIA